MCKLGVIGVGRMGTAIIGSIVKRSFLKSEHIWAFDYNSEKNEKVEKAYNTLTKPTREIFSKCETIILAVKPYNVIEVLKHVQPIFGVGHSPLIISVAAGIQTAFIERNLGHEARVIRSMPNTPMLVGEGATAICKGKFATEEDLMTAKTLFEEVGICEITTEDLLDAVCGLSGTGPAYVYTIIEAMIEGGVKMGLSRAMAKRLTLKTIIGSTMMVEQNPTKVPAALREDICSPAGTTAYAMHYLEERKFRSAISGAIEMATRRSRKLGEESHELI